MHILWDGEFEGREDTWLRWCYQDGNVLPTGDERARDAEVRTQDAQRRAQALAQKLREMGIDPDAL